MKNLTSIALTALLVAASGLKLAAQDRLPPIPADKMTETQKKAVSEITQDKGELGAVWMPLLRSPEVLVRGKALGDYLVRSKTALSKELTEFVILMVSRQWTQQFLWSAHYPSAMRAGLNAETAKAIGEGRRPEHMSDEEQVVYDFCNELAQTHNVSDATYNRMVGKLGEQGVIDTIALIGYYDMMAMTYNVTRYPVTQGATPPLAPLPH